MIVYWVIYLNFVKRLKYSKNGTFYMVYTGYCH